MHAPNDADGSLQGRRRAGGKRRSYEPLMASQQAKILSGSASSFLSSSRRLLTINSQTLAHWCHPCQHFQHVKGRHARLPCTLGDVGASHVLQMHTCPWGLGTHPSSE